jgi:hypothetical protein
MSNCVGSSGLGVEGRNAKSRRPGNARLRLGWSAMGPPAHEPNRVSCGRGPAEMFYAPLGF